MADVLYFVNLRQFYVFDVNDGKTTNIYFSSDIRLLAEEIPTSSGKQLFKSHFMEKHGLPKNQPFLTRNEIQSLLLFTFLKRT